MANIYQTVRIAASMQKVYNALTQHEGISAWWTPNTETSGKLGSIIKLPFEKGYTKEMKIIELEPLECVRLLCMNVHNEWIGTELSFRLLPGNKETLLQLYQEFAGQIAQQNVEKGTLLFFNHSGWKEQTVMFAECSYT